VNPGTVVHNRYELLRTIGEGAMGSVWLAQDRQLGREVALKLVLPKWVGRPDVVHRFFREARIMATLEHPNLIRVFDSDLHGGLPFVALEYVEGVDLSLMLERKGRLGPSTVLRLASEVGGALDALHQAGVMHRDVKPANVLVRQRDRGFVLMDLGLATDSATTSLTRTGQVIGTPRYMPPELVKGGKSTPASDIFQLGVVLFEAATGVHMIPGTTLAELGRALRRGSWAPFPSDLERFPEAARQALRRATAVDPEHRHGSCEELVHELSGALGMNSSVVLPARPVRAFQPRRSRVPGWLGGVLVLGVAAGAGAQLARWRAARPTDIRWHVVGDALVVDFRAPADLDVGMLIRGHRAQVDAPERAQGRRLVYRGLEPGREVQARLVWPGGREPAAQFSGDAAAVSEELDLAEGGAVRLNVRRAVTGRWEEEGVSYPLSLGRAWVPGPPSDALAWVFTWEEDGLVFAQAWDPLEVYDQYVDRMELAVLEAARVSADPVDSLRRSWAPAPEWLPRILRSDLSRRRRLRLLRAHEHASMRAVGHAWNPVPAGSPGGREALRRAPRFHGSKLVVPVSATLERDPGTGGFAMFTNAQEELNRPEFRVPDPLTFTWPEVPEDSPLVSLWLEVAKMDAGGRIRLQGGRGERRLEVHFFAPFPAENTEKRFSGWLRLTLPRDLLPPQGSPGVASLHTREADELTGFFMAYLKKLVVTF
jgi:serine/threonine-protein kinase